VDVLVLVEALFLLAVALLTSSFVISSVWERERRAALIGGVVLLVLVGGGISLLALRAAGFFQSTPGTLILLAGLVISLAVLLLFFPTGRNPKAQQGAAGYVVGKAGRFDERDQVFSRGHLSPDSEQYRAFYREHPEWEEDDAARREMGIPMGLPGAIDKPHEGPNVAALFASFSMLSRLGSPRALQPEAGPLSLRLRGEEGLEDLCDGFVVHAGAGIVDRESNVTARLELGR
jgi:hypothetical protein